MANIVTKETHVGLPQLHALYLLLCEKKRLAVLTSLLAFILCMSWRVSL